jgi:hypothetical protein
MPIISDLMGITLPQSEDKKPGTFRTTARLATPCDWPLPAHHTYVRWKNVSPGGHTRISVFPYV